MTYNTYIKGYVGTAVCLLVPVAPPIIVNQNIWHSVNFGEFYAFTNDVGEFECIPYILYRFFFGTYDVESMTAEQHFKTNFFEYLVETAKASIAERFDAFSEHAEIFSFLYDKNCSKR